MTTHYVTIRKWHLTGEHWNMFLCAHTPDGKRATPEHVIMRGTTLYGSKSAAVRAAKRTAKALWIGYLIPLKGK